MFSAENLIRMRKERGFSQDQLARRSGLATVTISKLEEGKNTDPKMSTIRKLATVFDCPLEAFFSRDKLTYQMEHVSEELSL